MKYRIHNIKVRYDENHDAVIQKSVHDRLGSEASRLATLRIARRSIDARQETVHFIYSVDITLEGDDPVVIPGAVKTPPPVSLELETGRDSLSYPPVVVGAGPAGLFAAYLLAKHGFAPILLERGGTVEQRRQALREFGASRKPNPECNALFGLGGAGTFSDGKLTTGIRHLWLTEVLRIFVECGAPPDILIDAKPHIGTDVLSVVVENLASRIVSMGGVVKTDCRVTGIQSESHALRGLETGTGPIPADVAVLAIGHSARDTWKMLRNKGVLLEPKPFQMGIRVEHPQEWLNKVQYGKAASHPSLGAADYKLTAKVSNRPVFSFCMCPGGETMATVSEAGHLAINGMSTSGRNSAFASSGLVVTLKPDDCDGGGIDSVLEFQRSVERTCFEAAGGDYSAPVQRLRDFEKGVASSGMLPGVSYRHGVAFNRLDAILPPQLALPLRGSLRAFERSLGGYLHKEAVVLGPESRASSPIRILRDIDSLQCTGISGLFPAGEGAGYAGGIMSSALDGLNAARKIVELYSPKTL